MTRSGQPGRTTPIKDCDLGIDEAAELEGEHGEQDGFSGAGWPDNQRVPDIADMQIEPERRRAPRLRQHKRWGVQMRIGLQPGPNR